MRLLLTATVTPQLPGLVNVADPESRRHQYVAALRAWYTWASARGVRITFVENSGEDLPTLAHAAFGERSVPLLSLVNAPVPDEDVVRRGIGAAEALMMDLFASSHPSDDELWIKCTGRLALSNADRTIPAELGTRVVLARLSVDLLDADTRFFAITSTLWRDRFVGMADETSKADGRWLERVLARRILRAVGEYDAELVRMAREPRFVGTSGSKGHRYDTPAESVKTFVWDQTVRRALRGPLRHKHY